MSVDRMMDDSQRNQTTMQSCALCAGAALLTCFAGVSRADIVDFSFTGNNGTADPVSATSVATNLMTPVQITRVGPDMIAQSHANSFLGNNWPTASSVVASKDYFSFTVSATAGHAIDLSAGGMSLNVSSQSSGPTKFVVRSSLDSFANNIAAPFTPLLNQASQYTFTFSSYLTTIHVTSPIATPIEFRLYAYSAAQTNKQFWLESAGNVSNAIQLTGTIVPVPEPTMVFFTATVVTGSAWLLRRRRQSRGH
jgi:hypothetical protein